MDLSDKIDILWLVVSLPDATDTTPDKEDKEL
jgi:hypothetical protein